MTDNVESNTNQLPHQLEDARWVWEEAARVTGLHRELAYLYRTKSKDKRTINALWERIEDGEAGLRLIGVEL